MSRSQPSREGETRLRGQEATKPKAKRRHVFNAVDETIILNGVGMDWNAEPYWLWCERMTAEVEQVIDAAHSGPRGEIPARPELAQQEEADPRTNSGQGGGTPIPSSKSSDRTP
jgi:hypothetical protein